MHPEVEKLLQLQQLDGRLEVLRKELETRPRIVAEQDGLVSHNQQALTETVAAIKVKKVQIDKADLEVKSADAGIEETRGKLVKVNTNQEFTALNQHIARLEAARSELEDQLLLLWDELEGLEGRLGEQKKELAGSEVVQAEESRQIAAEVAEIAEEVRALEVRRDDAVAPVDRELLEQYTRLFGRYRQHAVVFAENRICGGCHMSLSPQILSQLAGDREIVTCTNCSRILYL